MAKPDLKESFPLTLHRMLTEIDHLNADSDLRQAISWRDHGMAFKVKNKKKFIDHVMPIYFSRLKYCSWVRQLNSYGFTRITKKGDDIGSYCHISFIRGMPELAVGIERPPKRKNKTHHFVTRPGYPATTIGTGTTPTQVKPFSFTQSTNTTGSLRDMLSPAPVLASPSLVREVTDELDISSLALPTGDKGDAAVEGDGGDMTGILDQLWDFLDEGTLLTEEDRQVIGSTTTMIGEEESSDDDMEPLRIFSQQPQLQW